MSDLTEFNRTILPEVPGCPPEVAVNATREALRLFCARTCAWKAKLDAISMVAAQAVYDVTTPTDSEPTLYLDVRQDGRRLGVATIQDFSDVDGWDSQSDDTALWYIVQTPTSLLINPTPKTTAAKDVVVTVALKPTRTASTAADFLLDNYESVIASGALFKLLMMRDRKWSDPNAAAVHGKIFQEAMSDARKEVSLGQSGASAIAAVPFFS